MYSLCIRLLASEYLVFYLYNISLITEQQFTIGGLFDYAYYVYISLESQFYSDRREPKYRNSGAGCRTHGAQTDLLRGEERRASNTRNENCHSLDFYHKSQMQCHAFEPGPIRDKQLAA
jgi:hypothetical protein